MVFADMAFFSCKNACKSQVHADVVAQLRGQPPPAREPKNFTLEAESLSALEGGPLVVKVTLCYHGRKPIRIHEAVQSNEALIIPKGCLRSRPFTYHHGYGAYDGPGFSQRELKPGDRVSEIHYLHQNYVVGHGKVQLFVSWNVTEPLKWGEGLEIPSVKAIEEPSVELNVEVPRATPEKVESLVRNLKAQLREGASPAERDHVINTILYSSHEAVVPLALRILKEDSTVSKTAIIETIYGACSSPSIAHDRLIRSLFEPLPDRATVIIGHWRSLEIEGSLRYLFWDSKPHFSVVKAFVQPLLDGRVFMRSRVQRLCEHLRAKRLLLTDRHLRQLYEAPSVWVRALICTSFRDRCDRKWAARVVEDVGRLGQAPPAEEVARLLRDLDDKSFAVRDRATEKLLAHGDAVAPALRDALNGPLSAEARSRVRRVLDEFERQPLPPLAKQALAFVGNQARPGKFHNPDALAMLEGLSKGAPDASLVKEARRLLAEIKQARDKARIPGKTP